MVEGGGGGEKRKQRFLLPSPPPSFHFFSLPSQRSRQTRAETLATQAKLKFNGRSLQSMQNLPLQADDHIRIQKSHLHDTVSRMQKHPRHTSKIYSLAASYPDVSL